MKRTSTFPHHHYDFGSPVFIQNLGQGGTVISIRQAGNEWQYQVSGLSASSDTWWSEEDLHDACPRCFAKWDWIAPCPVCGYTPDTP